MEECIRNVQYFGSHMHKSGWIWLILSIAVVCVLCTYSSYYWFHTILEASSNNFHMSWPYQCYIIFVGYLELCCVHDVCIQFTQFRSNEVGNHRPLVLTASDSFIGSIGSTISVIHVSIQQASWLKMILRWQIVSVAFCF